MTRNSKIAEFPPAAVKNAPTHWGRNIPIAHLRRKLSKEEFVKRIGISRYVVADIEKGKTTTAIWLSVKERGQHPKTGKMGSGLV